MISHVNFICRWREKEKLDDEVSVLDLDVDRRKRPDSFCLAKPGAAAAA
jgi:hypothetical protein